MLEYLLYSDNACTMISVVARLVPSHARRAQEQSAKQAASGIRRWERSETGTNDEQSN
jgi:hypothetical protein